MEGIHMMSSKRIRASFKAFAVVMALALPAAIAISSVADARAGRGGSSGSRGSNTFSAPAATKTAPTAAQPMQRTQAQPTAPAAAPQAAGGMFSRPGMGMLGGFAAGFLGAGLLGMLFGGSLFGGLGGFASIIGLLLQVGLIALVVMLALRWWRSRNAPSYASGPANFDAGQSQQPAKPAGGFGGFGGMGAGAAMAPPVAKGPVKITPDDFDAFERLLGDVQSAWSNEDKTALARLTTPEMDGPTLLKEMRVRNPTLKVIFVSGYAEEAFEKSLPANEQFAFLPKPFTLTQLVAQVKETIAKT
jgi:predicted lipid-binding transport protein (Tim44 family)